MLDYLNSLEIEVEYLCYLGMQYDDDNQWHKSKECYQQALKINENSTRALQGLAVVCNRLGQIAESRVAMGQMVRSMREDESDRRALFSRGLYQTMYNQDWDKAADDFEALAQRYYHRQDTVLPEDNVVVENQQRGLHAPVTASARFTHMETLCHAFDNWLLDQVL